MNEELKIIIKAVTDSAKKGIEGVRKELEGLGAKGNESGKQVSKGMKGIKIGAGIAIGAIVAVGAAIVNLGKKTLGMQASFAKLNTAFEAAGSSARQAGETYTQLYRYLGDSDKAVEAANHLAKITTNQQNLAEWTKITQGIYASFGDSLPIEGLTEAANETIRVGTVTGNLADALNWAGVSEDELNAKLATTNSLSEREAIVRETLNGLYSDAAELYEKNNKAVLDYNESQARLDSAMTSAGAAVTPLLTALNNLGASFFTALKPALDAIIPPIAAFVNWIAKAIQSVMSFFSALTGKSSSIKALGDVGKTAATTANNLNSAASGASNLGSGMSDAGSGASDAAKAIEEAKRTTQGFDELNIVSDNSKSSSSSGGSSGGSGSGGAGYGSGAGLIDNATFTTEVEETAETTNSLVENIKNAFAGLAEALQPSFEAWSSAFDTVKESWNKAKPDFIDGAKSIGDGFVTLGSYLWNEFVPNVVNAFSVNLAPVIGDTFGFIIEEGGKQFKWFGEKVNTGINDLAIPALQRVEKIAVDVYGAIGSAWEEHGSGVLKAFSGTFEAIRGHLDNFYNATFKPIWDKCLEVWDNFWENGLKPLVNNFTESLLSIGEEILVLYNKVIAPVVDWILNNIFPILVNVINGIIETVGNVFTAISNTVSGIIDVIQGIIQFVVGVFTGDWEKAWEGIKNIFSGLFEALKGIIDALLAIFGGLVSFVTETLVAAFQIAWEAIKLVWDQVVAFFGAVWNGIVQIFSVVAEWFKTLFTTAWNNVKEVWNVAVSWFGEVWNGIYGIFSVVGSWFSTLFSNAWTSVVNAWSSATTWFGGVWNGIKQVFSNVGTWFKDIFSKAWQGVLSVFSATGQVFKGIAEGILTVFKTVVNFLIDGINKVVKLPFEGLNTVLNKIYKIEIAGLKPFSWLTWRAPIPQLPKLARGGIVDGATLAMIGEQGKEAVVPLENNTEWIDKLASRLSDNTPSKIVLMVDGRELGWASIRNINSITNQTGNLQLQIV